MGLDLTVGPEDFYPPATFEEDPTTFHRRLVEASGGRYFRDAYNQFNLLRAMGWLPERSNGMGEWAAVRQRFCDEHGVMSPEGARDFLAELRRRWDPATVASYVASEPEHPGSIFGLVFAELASNVHVEPSSAPPSVAFFEDKFTRLCTALEIAVAKGLPVTLS